MDPLRRQDLEKKTDEPTQDVVVMEEDTPEEDEAEKKTVLEEKVTTLEKEKEAMEKALREMEAKLTLQENIVKEVLERCAVIETAIVRIAEHVQRQNVFNESMRASVAGLVEEVKTNRGNFAEVARVLQGH